MDRLVDLVRLHRQGTGPREVARLLVMSPNTERLYRKALAAAGLLDGPVDDLPIVEALRAAVTAQLPITEPPQQTTTLVPWLARITELHEAGLRPRAIYDRLRLEDKDFAGTYWAMKRLCRQLRKKRGVLPEEVAIPVETLPGEIGQVDFGYVGYLVDPATGEARKAWCFVMVLAYSRHMVVRVVFDQKVETWLRLHVEAFEELGGVPETIVPDNLKSAVVRAAFAIDTPSALNRSYRELARHYGFKVDPAPPHAPKKKGKVEAGVKYVKRNFFVGRQGERADDVSRELGRWVREIAGTRVHGTTGRRPLDVFEAEERAALRPLPPKRFEPVVWRQALVHQDCHVIFEKRLFSAPWKLVGQRVWVRATPATVTIHTETDERVATHERRGRGQRSTVEEHLPDFRGPLRHRNRGYWVERAARLGPDVAAYVREVFDSDDVLSQLRAVQAIVRHLESFPRERAAAACRRASYYASYSYGAIKNILRQGLDLQPLPARAPTPAPGSPLSPQEKLRFARTMSELFHQLKEAPHESH